MTRSTLEIVVGGIVLVFLAAVFGFAYGGPKLAPEGGYALKAGFSKIDGLGEGDDVRLSGIKVGSVERQDLDSSFRAILTLRMDDGISIPADSSAAIHTDGLFGSKFVVLDPGGDIDMLKDGDEIQYTQDAVIVTDLLDLIISEGKARQARSRSAGGEQDSADGERSHAMRNMVETVMGAVVLVVAGLFVFFAYSTAQVRTAQGYEVTARFYKVGGLRTGADVQINGIKVGTVSGLNLDSKTYDAVVRMSIDSAFQLPEDTVAAIGSQGILGGAYVRLEPGKAQGRIASGGSIAKTKDYRSLEDQVGEIIFLATGASGQ